MTTLTCLQVTKNPSDQHYQLPITHTRATYAIAATREPSDSKGPPVDNILPPWMRVGYMKTRLKTVIPLNTFITYSTMAATNSLPSRQRNGWGSNKKRTHLLMNVTLWVSALTQIDNDVTASMIAKKDLRKNILRKVTLVTKGSFFVGLEFIVRVS